MSVVICSFIMTESSQGFDDGALCLGLAGVNHIVDFRDIAEMRMIGFAALGGNPALVSIGIAVKVAIAKIFSEQTELLHVIGYVFADISTRRVCRHVRF